MGGLYSDSVLFAGVTSSPVSVKTARDGFEAGQLTEVFRPRIVVLDINMPRIDGIELCRRLRATSTTAKSRIIILSGSLTEENKSAARHAGADAWIEKGASRAEILETLGLAGAAGAPESRGRRLIPSMVVSE